MDGVGAASAIVGLLDVAFSIIQAVRKARDAVKGASKTLDNVSAELDSLQRTLELVQDEARLQTPAVEDALKGLVAITKELQAFFDKLKEKQGQHRITKFLRALKDGDKDDQELKSIMSRLCSAWDGLSFRIQVIHIGLTGNQNDGFRVAYDVLMRVDANVKKALGSGLKIARVLEERQLQPVGGTIQLTDADVLAIEDAGPPQASSGTERFRARNLKAGNNLTIFEGDLGFDAPNSGAGQQSVMENVEFGNNARVNRGNVSKDVGKDFISAFWGAKSQGGKPG